MTRSPPALRRTAACVALASLLALAHGVATARERPALALRDVRIVDVERGTVSAPRTVLVEDGRIAAIGSAETLRIPARARRIDARGRYLIPGLVDLHVHLFNTFSRRAPNEWAFALFVANGVTSVREMAANAEALRHVRRWRRELAQGRRVAPRVLAAGIAVRGRDPVELRRSVDAAHAAGADFIKVFSELPAASLPVIVARAREHGLAVDGHAPSTLRAIDAASAGLRTNEHLTQMFEACSTIEDAVLAERNAGETAADPAADPGARILAHYDAAACTRTASGLAALPQVQVPTLVLLRPDRGARASAFRDDVRWPLLRADERERWARIIEGGGSVGADALRADWDVARRVVPILHAAGVPILAGTDAPMPLIYPGYSLHDELELLVASGLTEADALRGATIGPARLLGLGALSGSIAIGKRADLVLLDANPLDDIANTRRIRAVVLDGRLLTREALDALLVAQKPPFATREKVSRSDG